MSKKTVEKAAEMAVNDARCFRELIGLMKDEKDLHLAAMAAWAMSHAVDLNHHLIRPFIKDLIQQALKTNYDPIKRNIARVWSLSEIPEKFRWEIADICLGWLSKPKEAIAVKAYCLTTLQHLVEFLPEIKEEVVFEIERQLPHSGPAFRVRARAFLKANR